MLAALLNVTGWMVLMGLALLWLPASEAALIAYTMPVWASLLAWPVLGERPTSLRTLALVMAFAGLAAIMGGNGFAPRAEKLPGIIMALGGAFGFALGTVLSKKLPVPLPPITAAAWQIGLGCLPIAIVGSLFETTHLEQVTQLGWWLLVYSTVIQFCIAYVSWFAALARLPASVAAIGTMAVPVIGVVASAIALRRAARRRPDRRAGVYAGRRRAGDKVVVAGLASAAICRRRPQIVDQDIDADQKHPNGQDSKTPADEGTADQKYQCQQKSEQGNPARNDAGTDYDG